MPTIRDCSSADKPLSAEAVCAGHTQRAGLVASDAGLAWLENDPVSGRVRPFYFDGQTVHAPDIGAQSLGSRLNGYGGGALAILERSLILVADDQSVVSVNLDTGQLKILVSAGNGSWGGLVSDPKRRRVLAIREHRRSQALMALSLDGYCECLHQGEDFYGAPALSDDGNVIAWVSWRLPDMPWHRSHLWVGRLDDRGHVRQARALTPPAEGSVQQPVFYGEVLYALSDHAGWWQPWKIPDQSRDKTWEAVVPDVSLIDPEVTETMDAYLTACTGVDALVHAIEAFVSTGSGPLTDTHALEAIRLINRHLEPLVNNLSDPVLREQVMLASMQAGLAFSNAILGAVHAMSHSLGGFLDLPHGLCNALLLDHVVAYNFSSAEDRFRRVAQAMDIDTRGMKAPEIKKRLMQRITELKTSVGLQARLGELGVKISDIPSLSGYALQDPCILTNPRKSSLRDVQVVYEEAL